MISFLKTRDFHQFGTANLKSKKYLHEFYVFKTLENVCWHGDFSVSKLQKNVY